MGAGETLSVTASVAAIALMVVILAGIVAGGYRQHLALHQRTLELKVELARLELEAARTNPAASLLENRVRVLERIATDRTRDPAFQIDALTKRAPLLN